MIPIPGAAGSFSDRHQSWEFVARNFGAEMLPRLGPVCSFADRHQYWGHGSRNFGAEMAPSRGAQIASATMAPVPGMGGSALSWPRRAGRVLDKGTCPQEGPPLGGDCTFSLGRRDPSRILHLRGEGAIRLKRAGWRSTPPNLDRTFTCLGIPKFKLLILFCEVYFKIKKIKVPNFYPIFTRIHFRSPNF